MPLRLYFDAETLLPLKLYSHCWHREPATSILPPSDFYIVVSYGLLSYTLEEAILTCKLRSRKETYTQHNAIATVYPFMRKSSVNMIRMYRRHLTSLPLAVVQLPVSRNDNAQLP